MLSIKDERGQHWFNRAKKYESINPDAFVYFTPHHSLTEGRSLKAHGRYFHGAPKKAGKNGGWLGRGWPGTAYHGGSSVDHGLVIAWPFTNITYHAGHKANRLAIGWLLEGNFEKRSPTDQEYELLLAGKIFCDEALGRRLHLKYHNEWLKDRTCPGRYFDKKEFARLEQQYYIDKFTEDEPPINDPEKETPTQPEPKPPKPKPEDPIEYPRTPNENQGCMMSLFNFLSMRKLLLICLCFATSLAHAQQTCYTAPVNQIPAGLLAQADPNLDYCVDVKIEVGYDIYVDKGQNTLAWTTDVLDQVALIYEAEGITINWSIHIWESQDPYQGSNTQELLFSFRENHLPYTEDVAQLLKYTSSGGIAWVDVQCNDNFGFAYSALNSTYNQYPNYSWTVMVIAHELGHNLGSPHTHACAWNGNNTAIDGCAGFTEGNCGNPGSPSGGGTVMSYCHFTTGIDFNQGFHPQTVNLIKNRIAQASCADCDDNPPPPPPSDECDLNEVIVEIMPDAYPSETTWDLMDEQGLIVASGGPYTKDQRWIVQTDSLCLEDGCYYFVIRDIDGLGGIDGQCDYSGAFYVNNGENTLLTGVEFTDSLDATFCLGVTNEPCEPIVFTELIPMGTGSGQDQGQYQVIETNEVALLNNAWKGVDYPYEVTPNTVISFDVKIIREGEIHGIGFYPDNEFLQYSNTIKIGGTHFWGNQAYMQPYELGEWVSYEIPIGQYYQDVDKLGEYPFLTLINDMDSGSRDPIAHWKNIVVCEADQADLPEYKEKVMGNTIEPAIGSFLDRISGFIAPNPAQDSTRLPFVAEYKLFTLAGQLMAQGKGQNIDLSLVPPGMYLVVYGDRLEKLIVK